jgi:benzylsuccinate CoA-transferase BbsE subunit
MTGPLADVRVLDASGAIGHYAGRLLADLGADVIKVEPRGGDPARLYAPLLPGVDAPESGLQYLLLNANKRGVALDLEDDRGRDALLRLVAGADVLLESWRPEEARSLRLTDAELREANPSLIHTSITGFGITGPHAEWAYADIVGIATSGVMNLAGFPDGPPESLPDHQGYHCASLDAVAGTLTALLHRDAGGPGQLVEVAMQEALSIAQETAMQNYDIREFTLQRLGEASQVNPMNLPGFGLYECAEGMVYIMTTGTAGAGFAGLVEMMDEHGQAGDLKEEPHWSFIQTQMDGANLRRMLTEEESREETQKFLDHLEELVTAFMSAHPASYVYEEGQKRRVLVGLIATPADIAGDEHLADRDWFLEVEDAGRGKTLRYPGFPFRMHATPPTLRRPAPLLGEHTAEVLAQAGVPPEEIAALEATA